MPAEQAGRVLHGHPVGVETDRNQTAMVIEVEVRTVLLGLPWKHPHHQEEIHKDIKEHRAADDVHQDRQTCHKPLNGYPSEGNYHDHRSEHQEDEREQRQRKVHKRRSDLIRAIAG